jgi:hypothetical protein
VFVLACFQLFQSQSTSSPPASLSSLAASWISSFHTTKRISYLTNVS